SRSPARHASWPTCRSTTWPTPRVRIDVVGADAPRAGAVAPGAAAGTVAAGMAPIAPVVLFDLDGTLVDTAPDLRAALDALLQERGRPPCDAAAFRATVSRGGSAMLA